MAWPLEEPGCLYRGLESSAVLSSPKEAVFPTSPPSPPPPRPQGYIYCMTRQAITWRVPVQGTEGHSVFKSLLLPSAYYIHPQTWQPAKDSKGAEESGGLPKVASTMARMCVNTGVALCCFGSPDIMAISWTPISSHCISVEQKC